MVLNELWNALAKHLNLHWSLENLLGWNAVNAVTKSTYALSTSQKQICNCWSITSESEPVFTYYFVYNVDYRLFRWKGSGSSVNDNTDRERHADSRNKEAAWDEINNLKQKIREFSSRNPIITPLSRSPESKRSFVTRTSAYGEIINYLCIVTVTMLGSEHGPGEELYKLLSCMISNIPQMQGIDIDTLCWQIDGGETPQWICTIQCCLDVGARHWL